MVQTLANKNTTNKQYIHGDYDKDGVPNIDDKRPFDKSRKGSVNPEVSLSKTIRYVDQKRREAKKIAKPIAKKYGMQYRIKDTYSAINKAVRLSPGVTSDFIGLRKETIKREEAKKKWMLFNKQQNVPKSGQDNKYKTLAGTNNPYRAFHSNLMIKKFGAEAQFRTKKFGKLNDKMHTEYKKTGNTKRFIPFSKKLIRLGF